jgi:hypothetical protein
MQLGKQGGGVVQRADEVEFDLTRRGVRRDGRPVGSDDAAGSNTRP